MVEQGRKGKLVGFFFSFLFPLSFSPSFCPFHLLSSLPLPLPHLFKRKEKVFAKHNEKGYQLTRILRWGEQVELDAALKHSYPQESLGPWQRNPACNITLGVASQLQFISSSTATCPLI